MAQVSALEPHRNAQGCWLEPVSDEPEGTSAAFGIDLSGKYWIRISTPHWPFAHGVTYPIVVRGAFQPFDERTAAFQPVSPDKPVQAEGRGFVDSNGRHGIRISNETNLMPASWDPGLALYREGEAAPFLMMPNGYRDNSSSLRACLMKLARADRGSGKPVVRPVQHGTAYISMDDYPAAAIRANEQGSTSVRLTISAHGFPSDCAVIQSSGSASLDKATCLLIQRRTHFSPARDATGQPTEGSVDMGFDWVMPELHGMTVALPKPIRQQ
ncbi:energy transducer TonB [Sphingomonas sp. R-74633]|nr:energy transducer TonB [Sphingomonas sp. R-74633]